MLFIVEDNRAKIVPVELGINDNQNTEILSGLTGGELVVSEGFYALANEAKVTFSPPQS
jgi:multidrug efflux pump subunit AcrA (membrane-fusion protein)